jgi:hypothetical protein
MARVISIAEVVKYVGAKTMLGVTKLNYLAQLTPLLGRATFNIVRRNPQFVDGDVVQHQDGTRSARRLASG